MILALALILVAYLLGSVSTAILICRLLGLPDPRGVGSRNPGATNVLRCGGKKAAALTLAGDALKGLLPVVLAQALGVHDAIVAAVALAAFLGHLYPIWFGLQGGKGVATGLGALLGMHWLAGGLTGATWLLAALVFRISSLSALIALLLSPWYVLWLTGSQWLTLAGGLIAALSFWRHRGNIRNLLTGAEERIRGPG